MRVLPSELATRNRLSQSPGTALRLTDGNSSRLVESPKASLRLNGQGVSHRHSARVGRVWDFLKDYLIGKALDKGLQILNEKFQEWRLNNPGVDHSKEVEEFWAECNLQLELQQLQRELEGSTVDRTHWKEILQQNEAGERYDAERQQGTMVAGTQGQGNQDHQDGSPGPKTGNPQVA